MKPMKTIEISTILYQNPRRSIEIPSQRTQNYFRKSRNPSIIGSDYNSTISRLDNYIQDRNKISDKFSNCSIDQKPTKLNNSIQFSSHLHETNSLFFKNRRNISIDSFSSLNNKSIQICGNQEQPIPSRSRNLKR